MRTGRKYPRTIGPLAQCVSEVLEQRTLLAVTPIVGWSSYVGGSSDEEARALATDSAGNVYVAGNTKSFGWATGGFDTSYNGGDADGFVAKFNASGTLAWSTYLGGSASEWTTAMVIDPSGSVYVAGETASAGWASSPSGKGDTSYNGGTGDAFVVKINANGTLAWTSYVGGSNYESAHALAVDASGNVYVGGYTQSPGWISGGFDTTLTGTGNGFIAKVNADGSLGWSSYVGGTTAGFDNVDALATDPSGSIYMAGSLQSTNWATGGFDTTPNGDVDAFVAKVNANGTLAWSSYLGGSAYDSARSLATDASGNVYVAGNTASAGWAVGGADTSYNGGDVDGFVTRINADGTLAWSTYLGGTIDDSVAAIAVRSDGIYVAGTTDSLGWTTHNLNSGYTNGFDEGFAAQFSTTGGLLWSAALGGQNTDNLNALAAAANGNVYVAGYTRSTNWISGGSDTTLGGNQDAFVMKLRSEQPPTDITLSNSTIEENRAPESPVGTFATTDPDLGDTFKYTLVSGAGSEDNASFIISGKTLLSYGSFDYEAKSSYSIRVRTADGAGVSFEKAFRISVLNVHEATPAFTAISNDTGANAADRITADPTLAYSGTAMPLTPVRIYRDGVLAGTTSSDASGLWGFDDTATVLPDGAHTILAQTVDNQGQAIATSLPLVVMIDMARPPQPGVPALEPGSDTGTSSTDGITRIANPTLVLGHLGSFFVWDGYWSQPDGGQYLSERDGATGALLRRIPLPWDQALGSFGSVSGIVLQGVASDDQTIYVLFVDAGDNTGRVVSLRRSDGQWLGAVPVNKSLLGGMAYLNDSLYIASGSSLLRVDPTTGTILQELPTRLNLVSSSGANPYELSAIPERGTLLWISWNTASEISPATGAVVRSIPINVGAIPAFVGIPTAAYLGHDRVLCYTYDGSGATSISGRALVDLNTGVPIWQNVDPDLGWTWGASGEGDPESPFYRVFVDGVQVGGDYISALQLQLPTLADGTHTVVIQAVDAAGNASLTSDPLTITIDSADLSTAPAAPVLDPLSDTGASSTDGITNASELLFHANGDAALRYQLFVDGQVTGPVIFGGATVSVTDLGEGLHQFTWRQTNLAGDYSPASPARMVWIDRAAPGQPWRPALDPASDTGFNSADGVTSIANPNLVLGKLGSFLVWDAYWNLPGGGSYLSERDGATGALMRTIDIPWDRLLRPAAMSLRAVASDDYTIYLLFTDALMSGEIMRLQRFDGQWLSTTALDGQPLGGMAYLRGALYITSGPSLLKVDPQTAAVLQTIPTPLKFDVNSWPNTTPYELSAVAERGTLLWVDSTTAYEIDPNSGAVLRQTRIKVGDQWWGLGVTTSAYLGHDRLLCYTYGYGSNPAVNRALVDLNTGLSIWVAADKDLQWTYGASGEGDDQSPYRRVFVDGVQTGGDYIIALQLQLPSLSQGQHTVVIQSLDAAGNISAASNPLTITVDTLQPQITSATINSGQAQRSMVKRLDVTFSEPVLLSTGAITVRKSDGSSIPNTALGIANPSGDRKTYILTFSGTGTLGGSLADGIYDLIVSAAGVQDLAGNTLTANYTQRFHRLFGDSDGNRIINALDYARLKQTFGRAPTDPLFNSAFDYEGNNLINALDLARFRQRYGMSFSY